MNHHSRSSSKWYPGLHWAESSFRLGKFDGSDKIVSVESAEPVSRYSESTVVAVDLSDPNTKHFGFVFSVHAYIGNLDIYVGEPSNVRLYAELMMERFAIVDVYEYVQNGYSLFLDLKYDLGRRDLKMLFDFVADNQI